MATKTLNASVPAQAYIQAAVPSRLGCEVPLSLKPLPQHYTPTEIKGIILLTEANFWFAGLARRFDGAL
jgi:hypothetical protein